MSETTVNITLPFKKIHDDAVLPTQSTDGAAGLDCVAVTGPIHTERYVGYKLGFSVQIPKGYVGLLLPRSSISKTDMMLANSVGVIDSDYRGEVEARFKHFPNSSRVLDVAPSNIYDAGERVCQLVIVPIPHVIPVWSDTLSDTSRGHGGHGSTGK